MFWGSLDLRAKRWGARRRLVVENREPLSLQLIGRVVNTMVKQWVATCFLCQGMPKVMQYPANDFNCHIEGDFFTPAQATVGAVFFFVINFAYGWGPIAALHTKQVWNREQSSSAIFCYKQAGSKYPPNRGFPFASHTGFPPPKKKRGKKKWQA